MRCMRITKQVQTMADATVAKLADIEVLRPDGSPARFGEQWQEKPIILAMIRHFG